MVRYISRENNRLMKMIMINNINIIVCIKIRKYLSPIHKSYLVFKLKAYVTRLVSCVNYDQRNLTLKRGRRTS